jgi:3-oxoacyl-[acyl-carrier protein] reductase
VVPVVADHGTTEGRARLLAACPDPDILVITCSPPRFLASYLDPEPDEWAAALSTTLFGPVELMRATVGGMAERGFGRVVNIGTIAAKRPHESRLLSGPPRAALCNYSAAIAGGLAKRNVAINTILPGMFHTDSMDERFAALAKDNGTTIEPGEGQVDRPGRHSRTETRRREGRGRTLRASVQPIRELHHRAEHRDRRRAAHDHF